MPLPVIIIVLLGMIAAGVYNIRSLVRKWKHNPSKGFDLAVGIIIWTAAIVLLGFFLIKNHLLG